MKRINIQDFDASDVLSEKIDLPGREELMAANVLNDVTGEPIIDSWFKFNQTKFFSNTEFDAIRDLAKPIHIGQHSKLGVGLAGTRRQEMVSLSENRMALDTNGYVYRFPRPSDGDWSVLAVFNSDDSLLPSSNGSLIGADTSSDFVNPPMINITGSGTIRAFAGQGNTETMISISGRIPNIKLKPYLVVMTQSEENGYTCRVNASPVASNESAAAKRKSKGVSLRLLGSDFASASHNGLVFELILLNEDISKSAKKLEILEGYLMAAHQIVLD